MLARTLAVLMVLLISTDIAEADIIFQTGNIPQNDENILFNEPGLISTGNPVTGATNQTNAILQFGSNELLTTPSAGQARIEAVANPFNLLTIERLSGIGVFETAIFNLNATVTGTVTIAVLNQLGQTETQSFGVDAGGQNFFTLTSDASQSISRITISGVNLTDVRQIRIGGAGNVPPPAIPEPSTIVLLCSGLGAIALRSWSRRRINRNS